MSGPDLLFVYGTLRRGCSNEEARRLHAQATWQGAGRARGRLFRLGWDPALGWSLPGWRAGAMVTCCAWLILAQPSHGLTIMKSAAPAFRTLKEYRREVICIELFDAEVCAWAYLYTMPCWAGTDPEWRLVKPLIACGSRGR